MNKIIILLIMTLITVILFSLFINSRKSCVKKMIVEKEFILDNIKKRTPDFIVLETPKDKSYKSFCKVCKNTVDKVLKTGACISCNTVNVPLN